MQDETRRLPESSPQFSDRRFYLKFFSTLTFLKKGHRGCTSDKRRLIRLEDQRRSSDGCFGGGHPSGSESRARAEWQRHPPNRTRSLLVTAWIEHEEGRQNSLISVIELPVKILFLSDVVIVFFSARCNSACSLQPPRPLAGSLG